ncbi:protein RETARDED ROOT GROWTH, mitochondrial-like isoform X2 [Aristolochia californica]|uniref:protein RETARDED ROOT GROWTH, mitochondrial-like isoform X2 n=1 Tax=Aristolochia californica TaxID=171875 RepID=UPI0035E17B83
MLKVFVVLKAYLLKPECGTSSKMWGIQLKSMFSPSLRLLFLVNPSSRLCPRTFKTLVSPCRSSLLRRYPVYTPRPFCMSKSTNSYSRVIFQSLSSISFDREEPILSPKTSENNQNHEKQSIFIPVKAYFLSTSIDLRSLQNENADNVIPPNSRASNSILLRFSNIRGGSQGSEEANLGSEKNCCHMVVFQYGSMVLFNVSDHEVEDYLKIVEKHASGLLPEMRKDDYAVVEKPSLDSWMQGGLDYIILRNLNIDGIRTIGSVLGQSIALDFYFGQVDGMITEFTDINRGLANTGTFTMKRKKLFQLLGKANSHLADVILKLGLFERPDIVWKHANYALIWEYLRDEYELKIRFDSLDYKLKFVEAGVINKLKYGDVNASFSGNWVDPSHLFGLVEQ